MPQTATQRVGQVVAGRYRLLRLVGRGGMGDVYAAVHTFTRKHVALKLLREGVVSKTQVSLDRFLRESRAAATIGHPSICDVLDAGQAEDGAFYLVLELLEGEDLGSAMANDDLTHNELIEVGSQTLDGLGAAHDRSIVHRDIKPENLFLTRDEHGELRVKILDFGIAKRMNASMNLATTQEGMLVGTPYYLSPEQAAGETIDGRTDLWALGAVMFHALTKRPPFDEDNYNRLVSRILTAEAPTVRSIRPDVPRRLAGVIDRSLRRDLKDRWPSARHMAAALREERVSGLNLDWDEDENMTTRTASPFESGESGPPPMRTGLDTGVRSRVDELAQTQDAETADLQPLSPDESKNAFDAPPQATDAPRSLSWFIPVLITCMLAAAVFAVVVAAAVIVGFALFPS